MAASFGHICGIMAASFGHICGKMAASFGHICGLMAASRVGGLADMVGSGLYAISMVFQLLNGDSSQIHVLWTILTST